MIFKNDAKKVFLDTASPIVMTDQKLDIILSPACYWVKLVQLPVKSLREVKKLLPSLFEENLPEGNYSYTAQTHEEGYLIFAYDDQAVIRVLEAKGVASSQINNVYFAQHAFADANMPLRIDEESVLYVQEGIVVKLPAALVGQSTPLQLSKMSIEAPPIKLAKYGHIAGGKTVAGFTVLVLLLIGLTAIEWWLVSRQNSALQAQVNELYQHYGLKSTAVQNEAVLNRLEKHYATQEHIRKVVATILNTVLKNEERVLQISVEASHIVATYENITPARSSWLQKTFKERGLKAKIVQNADRTRVEVEL